MIISKLINPDRTNWPELIKRPQMSMANLKLSIDQIFENVAANGDDALRSYSLEFDKVLLKELMVSAEEFQEAITGVDTALKDAIGVAYHNIHGFHYAQQEEIKRVETSPGVVWWRESRAIERIGLYIPGGSAPLFSTVLMLGIPAQIAGCKEIVLCTPPRLDGKIHPVILYCAQLCGITKIFKIGGAQAIAAMSLQSTSVPFVYKIFGPGNQYVTAAKMKAQEIGTAIDMPAGPSEVLIYGDDTGVPSFISSDLLAQAEHGPDSQVIFVTTDLKLLEDVCIEVQKQLGLLFRVDAATRSLTNSHFIYFENQKDAVDFINAYAPEHLILAASNSKQILMVIENAGSIFLGNYTPESAGDYASGTNHTLPTSGFARSHSGVSLDSFIKKITIQEISKAGLLSLAPTIIAMAENEGLGAHAESVKVRLKEIIKES